MTSVILSLQEIASSVVKASANGYVHDVLQQISNTARSLAQARYAALGIPDGKGGFFHFVVSGLDQGEFAQIPHPPVGKGLLGVIMNERLALRVEDMAADPRSSGFPPHHPEMKSLLGVPILIADHLFGMLYLSDKLDGSMFTTEDQMLVEALAGYAALAIAGLELSQQQSRLSILEERERIAMELHDSIIQLLYAVGMELQLLKTDISQPEKLLAPILHLDEAIGEIRHYIMALKSAEARRFTVYQGLKASLDRLHIAPPMCVHLDAPDEYPPFDSPTFDSLCQICTEVASNALRHAQARTLRVRAYRDGSEFVLDIEDDGIGFEVSDISPGLGLINIRRRAQLHSGMVELYTSKGAGTRVRVTLPIR